MTAKKKEPGFDAKLDELRRIVARLEGEDLPLEEGVALFKEGVALAKSCRKQLESAKNEVMLSSKGLLEPFELDDAENGQERDDKDEDAGASF
jgi:exodeoxyribonuclease VII small subunit